jgi:hypothetical protein
VHDRDAVVIVRKGVLLTVGFLSVFTAFAGPKEQTFWSWFQRNSDTLYHFERNRERIFDQLAAEMHRINPDLTFEFGPILDDGSREFVISAGGVKTAFPAVEELFASAPKLAAWKWVKFRPRRSSVSDIKILGRRLNASDVHYKLYDDDDEKVGIVLFIPGYSTAEKSFYEQAGFLMLDEALGEYTMETRVGFIEFAGMDDEKAPGAAPIRDLGPHFDALRTTH